MGGLGIGWVFWFKSFISSDISTIVFLFAERVIFVCRIGVHSGARARRASGAPLQTKFGCHVSVRTPVQTLGEKDSGKESQGIPAGVGLRMPPFLGGKCAVLSGNRRFSWREITRPPSLLKKRFFKSLACLAKRT